MFRFKPIRMSAIPSSFHRQIKRNIIIQRQVRLRDARPRPDRRDVIRRESSSVDLVGDSRIEKAFAQNPHAARKRRQDHLSDVLAAIGCKEKQFPERRHRRRMQEEVPHNLAARPASGLVREENGILPVQSFQSAHQKGRLRRFPASVNPFE